MPANPCAPRHYEPTAIEKATAQIMADLSNTITMNFIRYGVREQIGEEAMFRAILAGYLEQKTLRDWCQDLGIEPQEPKT